jgi:hypothetical protein
LPFIGLFGEEGAKIETQKAPFYAAFRVSQLPLLDYLVRREQK